MLGNLNSKMAISKDMQKQAASDEDLWPDEEYAIEQYESGKDKPKMFNTPEELIEDLHKTE